MKRAAARHQGDSRWLLKLKLATAAVAAVAFTGMAQAETWQLLGSNTGAQHYVDRQSLVSARRAVEYWDRLTFTMPQAIGRGQLIKEIRSLSIANCVARTLAGEYYAVYDPQDKLLDVRAAPRIFRPVEKGSNAAAILDYVCRAKPDPAKLAQRKGGADALLALLDAPLAAAAPQPGRMNAFTRLINREANAQHIDPALVKAVIATESGFNPYAVSPKGAIGLMQLIPATARRFGVSQLFDPAQNIKAGVGYLSYLLTLFNHNVSLAVAAYNAGEKAIIKHGNQIPPFPETLHYVPKVLAYYSRYKK